MRVMVINGPNLNMLGIREPEIYGNKTYEDLIHYMEGAAEALDVEIVEFYQSNHEGDLVDAIQRAYGTCDGIQVAPRIADSYNRIISSRLGTGRYSHSRGQ